VWHRFRTCDYVCTYNQELMMASQFLVGKVFNLPTVNMKVMH